MGSWLHAITKIKTLTYLWMVKLLSRYSLVSTVNFYSFFEFLYSLKHSLLQNTFPCFGRKGSSTRIFSHIRHLKHDGRACQYFPSWLRRDSSNGIVLPQAYGKWYNCSIVLCKTYRGSQTQPITTNGCLM